MLDIQSEDEGEYRVIFPARLADNIRIQLEVGVKKPAGEVQQFRQGENGILSTPGDTQDGCKFVFQVGAYIKCGCSKCILGGAYIMWVKQICVCGKDD